MAVFGARTIAVVLVGVGAVTVVIVAIGVVLRTLLESRTVTMFVHSMANAVQVAWEIDVA